MLARYILSPCVRPCVLPSLRPTVTSRYFIETTGRIELGFGMEASFPHCVIRKLGMSKNRVLPSGTLSQTPNLKISPRQVDCVVDKLIVIVVVVDGWVCWRHLYDSWQDFDWHSESQSGSRASCLLCAVTIERYACGERDFITCLAELWCSAPRYGNQSRRGRFRRDLKPVNMVICNVPRICIAELR